VDRILRDAGLPSAEVREADAELPEYCRWLRKPLHGSGGQGIDFTTRTESGDGHFYQRFLEGPSYSAVYVRARSETRLLGTTEQLIGPVGWLNALPFRYAGSVGPVDLGPDVRTELLRIGETLVEGCALRGVFGMDFVLEAGRPHLVEINPRYTASIEVLERSTGVRALSWHRLEFDPPATISAAAYAGARCCAKAIFYAHRQFVTPAAFASLVDAHWERVGFADVPLPGEVCEAGWPILTLLAEADTRDVALRRLQAQAVRVLSVIAGIGTRSWYARLDDPNSS
jgi:predicted ATP-grasp superfamily ATP-dependent carboligase